MGTKLALKLSAVVVPALILVTACGGGAAPTPTTKPAAAPTTAAPAATKPVATTAATAAATKPAATTAATAAATKPAATAAATAAAAAAKGDVTAGKAVFDQSCNSCHPNGGQGAGPTLRGKNLQATRIQTIVRNGGGGMPAFSASQISDQQLTNLVAYVQSLQ